MKIERGHWIIAGITVALVGYITLYTPVAGYLSQRQANAAQAAAEAQEDAPDEGVANVTTAGSIATGTVLKREGVAVAELWGIKKIGAKTSEVVHFTSHDSEFRFREFLQGLRERETFALIGHELPSQSALWMADFNDPTHRLYTVETPDGETYEFCGWVKRIKTHPPLEGALVFEADVQCTHGPLTREVTEYKYYHCTEAPPAPGTPPPDDPGHWEEVDPPGELEDGESVFGSDAAGVWLEDLWHGVGGIFRYPSGAPLGYVKGAANTWPNWPATWGATTFHDFDFMSVHCVVKNDVAQEIRVHISNPAGTGAQQVSAALYRYSDMALIAVSDIVTVADGVVGFVAFPLTIPAALADGADYVLAVHGEAPTGAAPYVSGGAIAAYTPPDGHQWDPEEEYEYCQTVYYSTTVEETYCP